MKVWYIYWRDGAGRKRGRSLETSSKRDAEQFLHEYEVKRTKRLLGQEVDIPLERLEKEFMADAETRMKQSTLKSHLKPRVKAFMEFCKGRSVTKAQAVTIALLQDWQRELVEQELAAPTVNRYVYAVSAMLRFAVGRGYLQHNPVKDLAKLKMQQNPPAWLSQDDWQTVAKTAMQTDLWPMVAAAYYTGLRASELRTLTWEEIDFAAGLITVQNKPEVGFTLKNRTSRTVPLHSELAAILKPMAKKSGLCFPSPDGDAFETWELPSTFRKTVAIPSGVRCSLKVLRSTFASHLVQQGVSIYKVSRWLGHESVNTTAKHYAHLAPRDDEIEVL
jgi:integrase